MLPKFKLTGQLADVALGAIAFPTVAEKPSTYTSTKLSCDSRKL